MTIGNADSHLITAEAMKDSGWVARGLVRFRTVARGKAPCRVRSPVSVFISREVVGLDIESLRQAVDFGLGGLTLTRDERMD